MKPAPLMRTHAKALIFMLDSNAYDAILDADLSNKLAELVDTGRIAVLTTHIQQDEIARTSGRDKRATLQSIAAARVATSGAIWDLSLWDAAEFGEGSGDVKTGDVRTGGLRHAADALIGATAAAKADVLVTADSRLTNRITALRSRLQVWTPACFCRYLASY